MQLGGSQELALKQGLASLEDTPRGHQRAPPAATGQVSIRHHQADVKLEGAAVIWTITAAIIASSS